MQAEWQALRMGIKGADGMDTGKSTWSVKSYTNRFFHYMRHLTGHTAQTSDVTPGPSSPGRKHPKTGQSQDRTATTVASDKRSEICTQNTEIPGPSGLVFAI